MPTENKSPEKIPVDAVELAETLLTESLAWTTAEEAARMEKIARLIASPSAKSLSMAMTDRLFRSDDASRTAREWRSILRRYGLEEGFSFGDRLQLRAGAAGSLVLPGPVMAAVRSRLREESRDVILPAAEPKLGRLLEQRRSDGVRVNLNQLGEAVLGEEEASRRLASLIELLGRADVDYVSVKISAIFSQINLVAWEHTISAIKERLRKLYRVALREEKFVNLDMEEYRDLGLTVAAFRQLLDEPEFTQLSAGLALQAYLPDSIGIQRELTDWARSRIAAGGSPIKIRLVKGANLAMEKVEAELHGWKLATHGSKHETDAAFRRMLEFACRPENAAAVRLGVGSHNLFDVALALVLRRAHDVADFVTIEMLEGMAPAQSRAVQDEAGSLLSYVPIVKEADFGSALGYLIRRLDENTSPENFLADLFSLRPGSPAWQEQKRRFLDGWRKRNDVDALPNRATLPNPPPVGFYNQPDTDWTQARHRSAITNAETPTEPPPTAEIADVEAALAGALAARENWRDAGTEKRAEILRHCAEQIEASRFQTIALLRDEGKKAIGEADSEVSEAVDFARYYAETGSLPEGIRAEPLGTVVVTPPWNFPFAIPCGGVLAALMAGDSVILKPASKTARLGWWLANLLWEAGVPREVLHFVSPVDHEAARLLIEDDRTDAVILTGAYETARTFLDWRPSLKLFAETSGKNAIVVSALADRELAVKDLVRSAFGHSGQKCSAASLGILEAEVYDDPVFRRQLRDATASLRVGPATNPASVVTPLVLPPDEKLTRALTTLEEGEEWLLEPKQSDSDPLLWSPGIKLGVRPGSWFHQTECFGPVLGLIRAADLDEAIAFQNDTPYGLTAGLHTLDREEISRWKDRVEAGNLYINRGITGAIVQRQPFGGWKRSSIGPGAKAGGPNYVDLFRCCIDEASGIENDYLRAWSEHFSIEHDPTGLRCESNVFRYRPCRGVILRLAHEDTRSEMLARHAAEICGVPLTVSHAGKESDEAFAARLPQLAGDAEFLRTIDGPPEDLILRAAYEADLNWIDAPISSAGRVELKYWMREQSVTETRHRYGNYFSDPPPRFARPDY